MGTKVYDSALDLITFSRASGGTALRKISYGSELVTNGTFDTDVSGWTADATYGGTLTHDTTVFAGGGLKITHTASYSGAYQAITTTVGKTYVVTASFDKDGVTQTCWLEASNTTTFNSGRIAFQSDGTNDTGSLSVTFVATGTTTYIHMNGDSNASRVHYWDNISVKEVLFDQPDGTLTLFNHPTNIPRIEYAADGTVKGLLIEEARTNLVTYSEDFTDAGWSVLNGTKATGVSDPFGGTTAMTLTATSANGQVLRSIGGSAGTGTNYTGSFYIRRRTGTGVVSLFNPNGGGITATTITSEWQRYSVTGAGAAATNFIGVRLNTSGDEVDIAYAQFEAGSFPTSYISTSGSAATRSADIASIPVSAFGYNQQAGTVVVDVNTFDADYNNWVWVLDGTSDTSLYAHSAANGWRVFGAGGTVAYLGSLPGNADAQIGYAYNNAGSAALLDGGSVATAAHSQPVAVTTLRLGAASASTAFLNGHIKSIQYYPRRLANTQLQELTA